MNQDARQIQIDIPGLTMASELPPDPYEIYRDMLATAGTREINIKRVWAVLRKHRSRREAITVKRISGQLGLNETAVRSAARAIRRMGLPVCRIGEKKAKGYYVSVPDAPHTIANLRAIAASLCITANRMEWGVRHRETRNVLYRLLESEML